MNLCLIHFVQRYNTMWYKVCYLLVTGRWFSQDTPVSSTNKTDRHDITELLLKVALNTITIKTTTQFFKIPRTTKYAAGREFSQDTPVSSTNKTDHHDITEILWSVINQPYHVALTHCVQYMANKMCFYCNNDKISWTWFVHLNCFN